MFLLEQDITRKGRVDKKTLQLKFEDNGEGEEYEVRQFATVRSMPRSQRVASFQDCTT